MRQKVVFNRVADKVRKGEKISISKEIRESGVYSPTVAQKPQKLTRSKGWEELLEKYLPDSHLGKKHREFLDTPRIVRTYKKGDLETEIEETDPSAVKALDLAYKIKNKYKDGVQIDKAVIVQISKEAAEKYAVKPNGTDLTPSPDR